MKISSFRLTAPALLLGALLLATIVGWRATQPAAAETTAVDAAACHRIYLPLVVNGSAPTADVNMAADEIAPPPASTNCSPIAAVEAAPDFNGDGFADLAVGVPDEDVIQGPTYIDAGAVQVIYGTVNGLEALAANASVDDQIWTRANDGLDTIAIDHGDSFGQALAHGDFNDDGYTDLAIGVPGSLVDGQDSAGAVQVLYGSANGLSAADAQIWTQSSTHVADSPQENDQFGDTLAAGDFDGNGYDDLAIAIPHETVNGHLDAGAISIIFGSADGLKSTKLGGGKLPEFITQDTDPFFDSAEAGDQFGHTLITGNFDGDEYDDLAVGIPYEDFAGDLLNAGEVQIYYGSAFSFIDGDTFARQPQEISANTAGVDNATEAQDQFGFALAAADFDGNGQDDLAIGVPYETHGSGAGALQHAGAVNIVFGSEFGLDPAAGAPIWTQDSDGVGSEAEANEYFGWDLTAADFDQDGRADLAIGTPYDAFWGIRIGSVHILPGSESGPTGDGDSLIYDPGNPEANDSFGAALTTADTNGDGYSDLIVGARLDNPLNPGAGDEGAAYVFFGSDAGVSQSDNQSWYQGHNGLDGAPEPADHFGAVFSQ